MTLAQWNCTISDNFLDELLTLPPQILQRARRTIDRMKQDPWSTELHPEKIHNAEQGIHSCRVDDNYRIIWKHVKPNDIIFCLVDKHDNAYRRAARQSFALEDGVVKIADIVEVGAKTALAGGGELFSYAIRQRKEMGKLFSGYVDKELLDMGLPPELLPNVRALDDVNEMEKIERLLPVEVFDKLLTIALGIVDRPVVPDEQLRASLETYQGGDELCRFVDSEEFKRALAGDLEDWMIFLAAPQRYLVYRDYNGPARVKGVSGSGKTVVALHRARRLAEEAYENDSKIIFLTYGNRLPGVITHLLSRLTESNPELMGAIDSFTLHSWCSRFLGERGIPAWVETSEVNTAMDEAITETRQRLPGAPVWNHPKNFIVDEIKLMIKGRALQSEAEYLELERNGRGTPLRPAERQAVYAVYTAYQQKLQERDLVDYDDLILLALREFQQGGLAPVYQAAVVDEIQDLTEASLRLVRAMVQAGPNDLFLVGDGLQRIYPGGCSMKRLQIDVTGRSSILRRNYRNTQEILRLAHAMVQFTRFDDLEDQDQPVEEPEYSLRHGELPVLKGFASPEQEMQWVAEEIRLMQQKGYQAKDIAVLYRYRNPYQDLLNQVLGREATLSEITSDPRSYFGEQLKHSTFHSAKGLEFKVVFLVGVTDSQFVPRDDWTLANEELEDYLGREQRLLYVAMTRARDLLYITYSRGRLSRFMVGVPNVFFKRG